MQGRRLGCDTSLPCNFWTATGSQVSQATAGCLVAAMGTPPIDQHLLPPKAQSTVQSSPVGAVQQAIQDTRHDPRSGS